MWGILPVLNWSLGDAAVFDYHQIVLMPLAYQVGVLPALLAAAFDGWLAKWGIRFRVALCALFGFVVSFLPLLGALSMGFLYGPYVAIFGLLGAGARGCLLMAFRQPGAASPATGGALVNAQPAPRLFRPPLGAPVRRYFTRRPRLGQSPRSP
jgi:hypothetical protein